ncbi:uncharacterized protein [Eurosta solidaginis]|uniref:uncharacterized protein isoform X2 n=1 Tax=Eurosta solidaginis TaxID=178769 RepID=UPI00353099D9
MNDGKTKLISYMMKLPQENEHFIDIMRNHNIFDIERTMYYEIVPEFEQLYRQNGAKVNISAKCYNFETPSEFGVILLEDLRPHGYKNANRLEGLDLEHTKAVLERLAQWHAASAVRVETKGLYPEAFQKGVFNESQREMMENYRKSNMPIFLEALKEFKAKEIVAMENVLETLTDQLIRTSIYDPDDFNVLNHGDCWCNNVLFKYDREGNLEDTLLIDYQMINYGSPAKDLLYFLLSSTSYDVKLKHFDYFIRFYHENLVKNLKLLKYPKKLPTLKEMHIAVLKYSIWGISVCVGIMAVALLEQNNDANIDGFFGNSEAATRFRNSLYGNPRFLKHAKVLISWMYNRGFMEVSP